MGKNLILWVIIGIVLISVFSNFSPPSGSNPPVAYSQFYQDVKSQRVQSVMIQGREIRGSYQDGREFKTFSPESDNTALVGDLIKNGVIITAAAPEQRSILVDLLISSFPIIIIIAVWIYFMRKMGSGDNPQDRLAEYAKKDLEIQERIATALEKIADRSQSG